MAQKATPKKTAKKAAPPKKPAPKAAKRPEPVKSKPAAAPVAARKSKPEPKVASKPAAKSAPVHTSPARSFSAPPIAKEKKEKVVPLTKSDLQYFRNLLLERRREIIGDVGSMESEAFKGGSNLSNMPIHMADVGTDNFEQEFTLGLIESERQTLREIQEALIRIDDGKYGICQGTGKQIPRVRLEAMPWAKYTKEYSQALEQGKISRDDADASDDESGEEDKE